MNITVQAIEIGKVTLVLQKQTPAPKFGYELGSAEGFRVSYDSVRGYSAEFYDPESAVRVEVTGWWSPEAAVDALKTRLGILLGSISKILTTGGRL